jgi:hypothetical protein
MLFEQLHEVFNATLSCRGILAIYEYNKIQVSKLVISCFSSKLPNSVDCQNLTRQCCFNVFFQVRSNSIIYATAETKLGIPLGMFNASSSNIGMTLRCEPDEGPQIFVSNKFKLWSFVRKILISRMLVALHLWLLLFAMIDYYCGSNSFLLSYIQFGCLPLVLRQKKPSSHSEA